MQSPLVYELNARWWLRELSARRREVVRLGNVPEEEFVRWKRLGFTHIWLMGAWEVGPRSRAASLASVALRQRCAEILPSFTEADVVGSPFAPAGYTVGGDLGGDAGLERFRSRLHGHGLKLVLDFVPNHVGLDHPWVAEHPEWFVHGAEEIPQGFRQGTTAGDVWLAHGRDPYFPAWADTAQLDYRRTETRTAMTDVVARLAARCDGLRCDMAMLLLNEVFAQTWRDLPVSRPAPTTEFWSEAIRAVKAGSPGCLLVAEAYWGLEPRLLDLGFDYAYDKRLYDHLMARDPASVRGHLMEGSSWSTRSGVHFLENHDERRVAGQLALNEHGAAAMLILALPGMRLLHEGQLVGARVQAPVQLGWRPAEPAQTEVAALYERLLGAIAGSAVGRGAGRVLEARGASADNRSWRNLMLVQWQVEPPAFDLVVVNLASHRSQCFAPIDIPGLEGTDWILEDQLSNERFERAGSELRAAGLYLDVGPHAAQLFHFRPLSTV